jgi:hypothetical protein
MQRVGGHGQMKRESSLSLCSNYATTLMHEFVTTFIFFRCLSCPSLAATWKFTQSSKALDPVCPKKILDACVFCSAYTFAFVVPFAGEFVIFR